MKKVEWKGMACVVIAMMIFLAGCSGKETTAVVNSEDGQIPKTLTIFSGIGPYATKAGATSFNDTLPFQLMEELTGCHVEWIHPSAAGAVEERFNLMIASGNIPDAIVYGWQNVSGGAVKYLEDEIIIRLNELIDSSMPNLSAFMDERPDIAKQFINDQGEILYIPFIRKDAELKVYQGPQIRQDWLEKLGLEQPKTTDELYEVLKAFKTRDPNGNGETDEIPMSGVGFDNSGFGIGNLLGAFGTHHSFYVDNGKVKYGVMEERFEEGLRYISKLFSEGLIDIDYLLNDRDKVDAKVMNDQVGFLYSFQPGKFYNNMNDGERKVIGIPHVQGPYGDTNSYFADYGNDITGVSIAITTANENPSGTAKWLDNFFGGKGLEYMNFGKEGLTFEWIDDYPTLTDYLINNQEGKSKNDMLGLNLGAYESRFPTLQDWRYYEQILSDWGRDSINTWMDSVDTDGILPPLSFTEEESRTITQIMSQIQTYQSEEINKVLLGQKSIESMPDIQERIKGMGIDQVLEIYNDAYHRYEER